MPSRPRYSAGFQADYLPFKLPYSTSLRGESSSCLVEKLELYNVFRDWQLRCLNSYTSRAALYVTTVASYVGLRPRYAIGHVTIRLSIDDFLYAFTKNQACISLSFRDYLASKIATSWRHHWINHYAYRCGRRSSNYHKNCRRRSSLKVTSYDITTSSSGHVTSYG